MFSDWLDVYLATRPGVTGPGQVYRKTHANPDDSKWIKAMRLDLEYSENATLLGDIRILASSPIQLLQTHLGSLSLE
jgi:lipopolysaccharide/colanic/teichoic acid biosynthesis glycosyltransferase